MSFGLWLFFDLLCGYWVCKAGPWFLLSRGGGGSCSRRTWCLCWQHALPICIHLPWTPPLAVKTATIAQSPAQPESETAIQPHNKSCSDIRNVMVRQRPTCKLARKMLLSTHTCSTLMSILEVTGIKEKILRNFTLQMLLFPNFSQQFLGFPLIATSQCTIYVSYLVVARGCEHDWKSPRRRWGRSAASTIQDAMQRQSGLVKCCVLRHGKIWQGGPVKLDE